MEPLAYRMRPQSFEEIIGQEELLSQKWLFTAIEKGDIPSMVFVGPPGIGKTSIATLIAKKTGLPYKVFSAVTSTIKEVKEFIDEANKRFNFDGKRTIIFVDEIHRFNKAQQDAFLPWIENGVIIFLATTTENPSFYINAPLLSRIKVIHLKPLTENELIKILDSAIKKEFNNLTLNDDVLKFIAESASGDARVALNTLELVLKNYSENITVESLQNIISNAASYDKKGDYHYSLISAFIKSMRASDPDAAIYYLARMIESGEDIYFILRRMMIFASEDIGNADPHALMIATSAHYAFHAIGMPEGFIPISQAVTYLALAPKSNASYLAYLDAKEDVKKYGAVPPPMSLINPVTKLMKEQGYGKEYKYPHDYEGGIVKNFVCLPELLKNKRYYKPKEIGHEKVLLERLKRIKDIK